MKAAYDELRAEALGLNTKDYLELVSTPAKELQPSQIAAINRVKKAFPLQLSEAEQQ